MVSTVELSKIAIMKKTSNHSSVCEKDIGYRKFVDKLEQTEITMKLEQTGKLKYSMFQTFKQLQNI